MESSEESFMGGLSLQFFDIANQSTFPTMKEIERNCVRPWWHPSHHYRDDSSSQE